LSSCFSGNQQESAVIQNKGKKTSNNGKEKRVKNQHPYYCKTCQQKAYEGM
jgi:hypothetical protein